LLAAALVGCAAPRATAPTATAAPAKPLFDFHVGFWVNLHQRLYAESGPRPPREPLRAATPAAQAAWDGAVALYRSRYPDRGLITLLENEELVVANRRLAAAESAPDLAGVALPAELRAALEAAAPVYREATWPRDQRAGRDFVARLEPMIAQHGAALAASLAHTYQAPWPASPIRVDVAAFAGPVGAYTVLEPVHITIASNDPRHAGDSALEILFHEASHALVAPIERSIARACAAQGKPPPPTLWHAVLFYATGEAVRRELGPGYTPYALRNGLFTRGPGWAAYEPLLARLWPVYLDGRATLDATIDALVAGL